jgi:hypothetical protein
LVGLIKQVDKAVYGEKTEERAVVAFLKKGDDLKKKLEDLATAEKLSTPLVIAAAAPGNPDGYPLAADAQATVLVYEKHKVKANFALREGEIDAKVLDAIARAARENAGLTSAGGGGGGDLR